jgi:eukaryotic-like serine/threonine-protein kinase
MVQGRLPDRYRVLEEVGQGGMAVVYKAHDLTLKREVAVKVLHAHLLAEDESKSRLCREAQAVAKLHHDNIVQIFDYSGLDSAASYIVTEYIDGQTLKQFMNNRRPPPPEVAALIAIEIGRPLLHAHSLGIIHRDVKPDNVMVRKDGVLKLMDFGVAQIMDLERMTVTGQLLGSPAYMAPEILEGRPLDVRTDVFSVGIMLYQLATGALPFQGRNPHEVLKRIAEAKFADPRTLNRLIADRMARIISKALARKPDDRYSTVAVLLEDLEAFVADAGLDSARDELKAYFMDPGPYEKAVVPRMLAALVDSGKRERAAGKTARALELWNRALGMDPRNKEVLAELKRLETRQHLKRGSIIAGAVLALGGGAFVVFRGASETIGYRQVTAEAPRPVSTAPVVTRPAPGAGKPVKEGIPTATQTAPAAVIDPGAGTGKAAAVAAVPKASSRLAGAGVPARARVTEKRTFTIISSPLKANLTIDGQVQPPIGPASNTVEIPWDRPHRLEFTNECCYPVPWTLGPGNDVPPDHEIKFKFAGKPARLTVETTPPLTGKVRALEIAQPDEEHTPVDTWGPIGSPITIGFKGDRDMSKTLLLTIDAEGRLPQNKKIVVRAAENPTIPIKLD